MSRYRHCLTLPLYADYLYSVTAVSVYRATTFPRLVASTNFTCRSFSHDHPSRFLVIFMTL